MRPRPPADPDRRAAVRPRRRAPAAALAAALFVSLALVVSSAAGASAGTQEPPAPEAQDVAAPAAAEPSVAGPAADAERLDAPRAVMRAFLEGMVAWEREGSRDGLARATAALDLSDVPAYQHAVLAPRVARELKDALDRVALVELDELPGPDDPRLASGSFVGRWARADDPEAAVAIVFARGEGGGWRIAPETVAAAPELARRLRGHAFVEGLEKPRTLVDVLRDDVVPERLQEPGFLLEHWQWIGLFLLLLLAAALDRLGRAVASRLVRRTADREREEVDRAELAGFVRPVGIFVGAYAFGLLLHLLDLEPGAHAVLALATSFVLAVAGVWAAYRLVDLVASHLGRRASRTQNRFDDMLVPLLRRTLKIFVVVVGVLYVASKWTDDLWGLVAGIGIGSIAVGFAARDSIENLFGTFTVLLDKPFQIGDWILVGDLEGTVEEVGFRSTRIRTFYNSLITVPNRTFISSNVDNMGRRRYRRVKTRLSLPYDTPPERVDAFCAGVRRLIERHPYTRKDYYHVYLNELADHAVEVLLYAFVETPDWSTELRERHRLLGDVLRLAEKLGVRFALPARTVHLARAAPSPEAPAEAAGAAAADAIVGAGGPAPPPVTSMADPHAGAGG